MFSPWRMKYVGREKEGEDCAFCSALEHAADKGSLIVHMGRQAYVILNLYPYTSGHLMTVPFKHCQRLDELEEEVLLELMTLAKQASEVLEDVYKPQGFNLGMNVGKVAGAGIAEHLHLHIVPRWNGDANFISVVGQTRVLPDGLEESHQRLSEAWKRLFPEE
jgi:ATP adenylyltransferase